MNIGISLHQGKKYNQYQNKIKKGVEKNNQIFPKKNVKEAFQNDIAFKNVFVDEIKNRVNSKIANAKDSLTLQNLMKQYNDLASQYKSISNSINNELVTTIKRSTADDLYRGSIFEISNDMQANDAFGYVTNMGVYKPFTDFNSYMNTGGRNGCPSSYGGLTVDNPQNVTIPGSYLNTEPSLLVGDPMESGQSCGYEGQNVYVNTMSNNENLYYEGCYYQMKIEDNPNLVINGDFSNPPIGADSYLWVPGILDPVPWYFYATLVNNSSYLQVPRPYPVGDQCCFIQNLNYINQFVLNLDEGTYICSFYIAGRDYANGPNPIEVKFTDYYNGNEFQIITPTLTWNLESIEFYNPVDRDGTISFSGTMDPSQGDYGSFIQGVSIIKKPSTSATNTTTFDPNIQAMEPANIPYGNVTTFENCKLFAQNNSYPIFGLNNTQPDGTGTCMVSKDIDQAKKFGQVIIYNTSSVWNSGATGIKLMINGGQMCIVDEKGNNTVCFPDTMDPNCVLNGGINSIMSTYGANCNGQNDWTVPIGNANTALNSYIQQGEKEYNYLIGTGIGNANKVTLYSDPNYGGSSASFGPGSYGADGTLVVNDTISSMKVPKGMSIIFDAYNASIGQMWAFGPGDYPNFTQMPYNGSYINIDNTLTTWDVYETNVNDPAYGCPKNFDISYKCGNVSKTGFVQGEAGGKNYLIDCSQEFCSTFLALQTDGNLCLYKGSPGSIQSNLFCTNTNDIKRDPNPNWVATKGKYGRSYMITGEYLNKGEWMGSDDGSCRLIMQDDGYANLVLNNTTYDCSPETYGFAGNAKTNAIYLFDQLGNKSLIGKVGYVDENAVLKEYPSSMIAKSSEYDFMKDYDSWGNDLPGMPISNTNVDACKVACDDNINCNGYVFDNSNNNCFLKDSNVYPEGPYINQKSGVDLYVRKPQVYNNISCNKTMNPIDSIQYQNYKKNGMMSQDIKCGIDLTNDSSSLIDIENKLAALEEQIATEINSLENINVNLNNQMNKDHITIKEDIKEYKKIQQDIAEFLKTNPNFKNIGNNYSNSMGKKEGLLNMEDIDAMETDSDLNVLKNNYQYIFWSILALGAIIVTINILKK